MNNNNYNDIWHCIKCGRVYHNLEFNELPCNCFCGNKVQKICIKSREDLSELNINWHDVEYPTVSC